MTATEDRLGHLTFGHSDATDFLQSKTGLDDWLDFARHAFVLKRAAVPILNATVV